jgi:hypothetical protein
MINPQLGGQIGRADAAMPTNDPLALRNPDEIRPRIGLYLGILRPDAVDNSRSSVVNKCDDCLGMQVAGLKTGRIITATVPHLRLTVLVCCTALAGPLAKEKPGRVVPVANHTYASGIRLAGWLRS